MLRRSRTSRVRIAAAVAVLCLGLAGRAHAQDRTVTAGVTVRFVSGTFGSTQTSHILFVPAELRVDAGRLELAGMFPYLSIADGTVTLAGPAYIPMRGSVADAPGAGMPMQGMGRGMMSGSSGDDPAPAAPALLQSRYAGAGDVLASLGFRVLDSPWSRVQFVTNARVKIPTASASSGLGTGRPDVALTGILRKRFDEGWVTMEAGYLAVGDPVGFDFRNATIWSVGTGRRIASRFYLLASGSGSSAVVVDFAAPVELSVGLGVRLTDVLVLTAAPTVGLTRASPSGFSVGLSTTLFQR